MDFKNISWDKLSLKTPELVAIVGIIFIYFRYLPKILNMVKESDFIRFFGVLAFVSCFAFFPCILLFFPHGTRIAQEELRKSREQLNRALSLLRERGIESDRTEDQYK